MGRERRTYGWIEAEFEFEVHFRGSLVVNLRLWGVQIAGVCGLESGVLIHNDIRVHRVCEGDRTQRSRSSLRFNDQGMFSKVCLPSEAAR